MRDPPNGLSASSSIRFSIRNFLVGCARLVSSGSRWYFAWLALLGLLIAVGLVGYSHQISRGLLATNMRDQVSWGFYIGNFTFLVGVAAAAVLLVVPAYVYAWKPIKEVVVLGEMLAISALVMCMLFILVDTGSPLSLWHILPWVGTPNFPRSMLVWDSIVLTGYLLINTTVVAHILYRHFSGREYDRRVVVPLVLLSIPWAVAIHTVTAFLYNGMSARPYWNASILAPRFLASAFCSGPAILLVLFQILRKTTGFPISDEAISKIAEIMSYAMFVNLFLLGAEVFKEFYSATEHLVYTRYLYFGLQGHHPIVVYGWASVLCSTTAFLLFIVPATRRNFYTLNLGCLLIFVGVYIEKGIGLVIPGMTPDTLGEIYEYTPSVTEWMVAAGVFGVGFLIYTQLVKIAVPILDGRYTAAMAAQRPVAAVAGFVRAPLG
jgi:molybdopterin-containing oxidoreductase family membrane subunit